MTSQQEFGGFWTEQKLDVIGKYLKAYTTIFNRNLRGRYYSISYVDAFAGTGSIQKRRSGRFKSLLPEAEFEEEFRKGSVLRALEVEPPFDKYVFIEKSAAKCKELQTIANRSRHQERIRIVNDDANTALMQWCAKLDARRQRAVVLLDPFGASVRWEVIAALGRTRSVDLWVLFPYSAINRMLVRNRRPPKAWAKKLTAVFGTDDWEDAFYSTSRFRSLLNFNEEIERVQKSVGHREITDFFVTRLRQEFEAVSTPLPLHNSNGALLFMLFFAAGNQASAKTGLKIANDIVKKRS